MRVAIVSAFPQEVRAIVRNTGATRKRKECVFDVFHARYSSHDITLILTGMGSRSAEKALAYVVEKYVPEIILSAGFGGALYDGARIGEIIVASKVLSLDDRAADVLELRNGDVIEKLSRNLSVREGSIVTIEKWKQKSEIRKVIAGEFPLPVCDMETFGIAKLSLEKNLPFFAVRSITDRSDEEVPLDLLNVSDDSGRYSLRRAIKLLLFKPRLIPGSIKLGIHAHIAGRSLWQAVSCLIDSL
ncbi:MAG TPA: hypothetical protein VFG09_01390 [Thermodesulfovibrionales bacterium]|jgi:nucleoside phosphorylase|nr:hypothetical protein [Thermodesulfovibrionales bacterium]